jgi:23S rRNA (uracil1939-C5)-methyltransferase
MKSINEIRKVKCVDFTFDGQGLAKDENNRVIFVPSLLIDEEAEVEILYKKKDFDVGKIKKITKFSEFRINSKCPCSTSCGGCSFQNLEYSKELEYKKKVAVQTLSKIAGVDARKANIYGMDEPYYYRNKIQVPFGYDKQKRLVYGFYKIKSHDIVPITECAIQSKEHVEILKAIKDLIISMRLRAYDEDTGHGTFRHVLIRVGKVTKEVMVVLVVKDAKFASRHNFVKALIEKCPNIKTIVLNENPRKTNIILGNKEEILYGPGFIYDYLLGVKFKISSKSFYQVNHDQCEKLYSLAISKAELKKSDVILDAYCGIGTIVLIASKHVKSVDEVEVVE